MHRAIAPPTLIPDLPVLEHGLVCERLPCLGCRTDEPIWAVARTNVTQELWPYGDCGLDWWPGGYPRGTLALAVLDHFLPRREGEVVETNGVRLACSHRAWELHLDAAAELLVDMPYWGGALIAPIWTRWISDKLKSMGESYGRPCQREGGSRP